VNVHAFAMLLCTCLASPGDALHNLDFGTGTLAGWEGDGFSLTTATGKGPSTACAVSSGDLETPGRTGRLARTWVVPGDAAALRCKAYAARPKNCPPEGKLDVLLVDANHHVVPKHVYTAEGWRSASALLPRRDGQAQEYRWSVAGYAGQTLRLVLVDEDKRPGCHVFCTGFRILSRSEQEAQDFSRFMVRLQRQHQLSPMVRYDTPHFTALSNAEENFSEKRLHNCELLYRSFFDHFRRKGFAAQEPPTKLMVAIFDTEAGLRAYLGPNEWRKVQGLYDSKTNRLVMYDYRQNQDLLTQRQRGEQQSRRITLQMDRERYLDTLERQFQEFSTDVNICLNMHEVAHQLSFNGGMLNRQGDVPVWLAEGLAGYCEPTDNGRWQGIGQPNPERLASLAKAVGKQGRLIPLLELITGDGWNRQPDRQRTALYYAQSWILFQMLMEERPQAMRSYLGLIYPRQTPEHRLTDFRQAFGADLSRLEARYAQYIRQQVERHGPPVR
jgi:hypothetical protein